jgi:hypothetical protein
MAFASISSGKATTHHCFPDCMLPIPAHFPIGLKYNSRLPAHAQHPANGRVTAYRITFVFRAFVRVTCVARGICSNSLSPTMDILLKTPYDRPILLRRINMNIEYKGYRITAWPELDDTTGLWNGRYRILDEKGVVAYESFVEPSDDEGKAHEAASAKARAWVDEQ